MKRRRHLHTLLSVVAIALVSAGSAALVTTLSTNTKMSPPSSTAKPTKVAAGAGAPTAPTIRISQTSMGTSLSGTSIGVSFEATNLLLPAFTSGNLAAYLKTLGTSVIRIGGNTVDQTFWSATGETAPGWSMGTITDADLARLNTLSESSGWKIVLGVNLKHFDPERAADEADHASDILGKSLLAIEIGNEPDRYPQYVHDAAKYIEDFQAYFTAIRAKAPDVPIDGTDAAWSDRAVQTSFVAQQATLAHPQIQSLTNHYYPLISTTCRGKPTMADLLGKAVHDDEVRAATVAAEQGKQLGVPAVIDESNNVVCEGQPGISDVFAAALWELDMQLVAASTGLAGDYQHGTVLKCGSEKPLFMYYTPLCAKTSADTSAGLLAAQPEFYGLAAVHEIGTGTFLILTNPIESTVRAYAIRHDDGTMTVVLDDMQDPRQFGPTTVQLDLGSAYGAVERVDLTASGLDATTGIRLGGQTVHSNGRLPEPHRTKSVMSGDTMVITIPAGSAALLTFVSPSV
jgi:hypothetical protein